MCSSFTWGAVSVHYLLGLMHQLGQLMYTNMYTNNGQLEVNATCPTHKRSNGRHIRATAVASPNERPC